MKRSSSITAAGFSALSPFYDLAAEILTFGSVRRAQQDCLADLSAHAEITRPLRRVLIVGGGTGLPLEPLAAARPRVAVTFIEPAAGMRRRAARRAARLGLDVSFVADKLEDAALDSDFDLICTPFFLDLFDQPQLCAQTQILDAALCPGGLWLEADFFYRERGVGRIVSRTTIGALYGVFKVLCGIGAHRLPDTATMFKAMNYKLEMRRKRLTGMIETRLYRKDPACED